MNDRHGDEDNHKGYEIHQRPCPECGHEQHDMVMEHRDLVKSEAVEALCTECGTAYAKPVLKDGEPNELFEWQR